MEQFWRNAGRQLGKQWKAVLAVVVVLTGVLAIGATRIEFATGQDSYLNPDSQIAIDNVEFQGSFGGETVILLFNAQDGADVSDLLKGDNLEAFRELNDELSELPEVFSVVTPLTSITFSSELVTSEPVTSTVGTNALLAAAGRDDAGGEARSADISVSLARRAAAGDQTLDNPDWIELLVYGNEGFTSEGGTLTAPSDGERQIRLSLQSTFPNVEGGAVNSTAVGGIVLNGNATLDEQSAGTAKIIEIMDDFSLEGFDVTVTGSPVYLAEINDYLKGGMLTLGAIAMLVMAVILFVIFKVRWRLLPLLSVLIGVLWSFSILGLIGIDLSLVTIAGLPILIGLGIDFAIQIHNRVEEEVVLDRDAHPISESVANVAPPMVAAAIAGVLAFVALRISKVPMIRDFGVLLAVGVVVLVTVGIVVPAAALGIREWTKPTETRPVSQVEKLVVKLGGLPTKLGLPLIVVAMALFVGGVLAEGSTKIQSDPVKWIDQGSQTVADIDKLEADTGFGSTLGILVQANNVFDPAVVQLINDFTVDAEARPDGAVVSSSSFVTTMSKIIRIEGATVLAPTSEDVVAAAVAAEAVTPDISRVLVNDDATAAQVNLRLAPGSLDERAVLVQELRDDLDARIADLDVAADSILLTDLPDGQSAVRATPAGLATVGIGLLENLSANRANLTYLALMLAGIFLVARFRSATRAVLALVPVLLAVGVSSLIVGLLGFELSPLTTVSGPLVIASCAEFSVLILGRYLEERQRGLEPRDATDMAASRTGRAFFTSALTTIGGFAVLIVSPLPLLRDFGIIVTLNVAIALLAALVVMPPLSVWVDEKGWLGTQETEPDERSVKLAALLPGKQTPGALIAIVALIAGAIAVYATADTTSGESTEIAYAATALPTTTTTTTIAPETTTTVAGEEPVDGPLIDPSTFGTDRPASLVGGVLFDLFTSPEVGVAPNVANCTIETLNSRVSDDDLLALGAATAEPAAVEPITQAALDCGMTQNQIDRAIAIQRGEEPPPVVTDDGPATATTAPAGPLIDPTGFPAERPVDVLDGILFDLLVGGGTYEGQGVDPQAANCAVATVIERYGADELLAELPTQAPAAVDATKQAAIDCGLDPVVVDGALVEFGG